MSTAQHEKVADPLAPSRSATDVPGRSARGPSRILTLAAAATAVAALILASALLKLIPSTWRPADTSPPEPHLPTRVNTPGSWSDEVNPEGPWAAVGVAMRSTPQGLRGERQHLQLFAVSAVDGRSAWVSVPGGAVEQRALVGWFALSPDGRRLAWSRELGPDDADGSQASLLGWAVMDTTTGHVRRFADPASPRLRPTAADLGFSGDSRYLLTSYERPRAPRTRGHQFVAWDVTTGRRTVLERPGHYWLPTPGSAPTGAVWSRGRTVFREDPTAGHPATYALPHPVTAASWAPHDRAFAYIGRGDGRRASRLYAGPSLTAARDHALHLDVEPDQLLGWRDDRHVVVGHYREDVRVVDVVTGQVQQLDTAGYGEPLNAPMLAGDLWRNPMRPPPEPTGTSDPRTPNLWGGSVLAVVVLAGLALWRRRLRAL